MERIARRTNLSNLVTCSGVKWARADSDRLRKHRAKGDRRDRMTVRMFFAAGALLASAFDLRDVGARRLVLCGVGGEDGRAVLGAGVRPLAIQLGRVVGHREVDLQQLGIGHLARVVHHLDRLGMAGAARADGLVTCGRLVAPGITRDRAEDPLHMLEHALHAPEATAGQHRGLGRLGRGGGERISGSGRHRHRPFDRRRGSEPCGHAGHADEPAQQAAARRGRWVSASGHGRAFGASATEP